MLLDDRVGDGQAQAGALADFLRREERIEDARLHVFRHARPVVVDFEDDGVASGSCQVRRTSVPRPLAPSIACSALMIRLSSTCWNWCGSANTSGRPAASASMMVMLLRRLFVDRSASVSRTIWLTSTIARVVWRLRAKVSRLRTIFAARSDSLRIVSSPRLRLIVDRALRQPLGPGQDRGERVVQLVRDAGDRLAQRGELLRLQQLVIQIARLVLEPLALADVAHQRLDADARRRAARRAR